MIGEFRGFERRIYILGLGWLITSVGFAMVIPFISIYFHQELGLSMSAVGLFFGLMAVLRAIPQPFAGWLSDRIGRVPIMGWSQVLRAITFAGVGYAIIQGAGFYTIALVISFNFILGAVLHPAANAMVADLVPKEKRIPAFAFLRISGNLGWAIGPAMGGYIAYKSYGALFYTAAVMAFLSGIFFLVALKDVPIVAKLDDTLFRIGDIFRLNKDKRLLRFSLISFVLFLAVAQLIVSLSVFSTETIGISRSQLGTLYAINGLMVVVLQFPISHIFKRYRLTTQLALGSIIYAVGYFFIGFAPGMTILVTCMVVITIAEMIVSPPAVTMVANLSKPGEYGRSMGLFGFFQMAGWSLGPTVGGVLLDIFSDHPVRMWTSISFLAVIAFILYIRFGKRLPDNVNSAHGKLGLSDG